MSIRETKKSLRFAAPGLLVGVLAFAACSATDGEGTKAPKNGQNQPGDGTGGDGLPDDMFDDDAGIDDGVDEGSACAAEKRTGELVPLDMYVMLDKSGSMSGSYWASVTAALKNFVDAPESVGMGMGIQYFPTTPKVPLPPAPASCTTDADCAPYWGDCIPGFFQCDGVLTGGLDPDSCNSEDYAIPDVPMQLLPMVSSKIKDSLNKQKASGGTPTYPALMGAHKYATQWAKAHPGHVTVVVLATDGDPSGCSSSTNNTNTIAQLAEDARKANPSVSTFVIGVGTNFTSDLDIIASSGGTDKAIFVDGGETQEFLDALVKIRGSVACEYQIPVPADNKQPDYERVNVTLTHEGKTETIGRVAAPSECDPTKGGWYYDNPQSPSKIKLCEKSCQLVKSSSQMAPVEVDVLLGCRSQIW